jgi:hypothetical protein
MTIKELAALLSNISEHWNTSLKHVMARTATLLRNIQNTKIHIIQMAECEISSLKYTNISNILF